MEPLKPPAPTDKQESDSLGSVGSGPKSVPASDDQVRPAHVDSNNVHPANVYPPPSSKAPAPLPPATPQPVVAVRSGDQTKSAPITTSEEKATAVKNFGFIEVAPVGKKQSNTVKKSAIAVVATLFLILVGSAVAYFGYFLPNEPKYVVAAAFFNTINGEKLNSESFNASISSSGASSFATYDASVSGSSNRSGAYNADLSVSGFGTSINFDTLTTNGQKYYMKLGGLDQISSVLSLLISKSDLISLTSLINSVNNRWFYFQPNQSIQAQIKQLLNVGSKFTSSDIKKLTSLYEKNEFLNVTKTFPDQTIGGADSHYYQVSINSSKLSAFLAALPTAGIASLNVGQNHFQYLDSLIKGTNLSNRSFNVWINKSNKIIDQISFTSTVFSQPTNFQLTLSNINKPVKITPPSNAITLPQMLTQVANNQVAKQLIYSTATGPKVINLIQHSSSSN